MSGAAMEGCASMKEDVSENHMAEPDHCGNMGNSKGSMIGRNDKNYSFLEQVVKPHVL